MIIDSQGAQNYRNWLCLDQFTGIATNEFVGHFSLVSFGTIHT